MKAEVVRHPGRDPKDNPRFVVTDLDLSPAFVPLVWISLQLGKGLLNVPGGRASDRYGRKRVLALS